jgi:hypothetical protein
VPSTSFLGQVAPYHGVSGIDENKERKRGQCVARRSVGSRSRAGHKKSPSRNCQTREMPRDDPVRGLAPQHFVEQPRYPDLGSGPEALRPSIAAGLPLFRRIAPRTHPESSGEIRGVAQHHFGYNIPSKRIVVNGGRGFFSGMVNETEVACEREVMSSSPLYPGVTSSQQRSHWCRYALPLTTPV